MLAIIPARGGSKGLPKKNTLPLCGKPLIAYTIQAALEAKSIDRVVVSTDCTEIAETSRLYGAEVPFMRPEELAADDSQVMDAYMYTVERLGRTNEPFMALLPTAPLRTEKHIEEAIFMFNKGKAQTLISVTEAPVPLSWYLNKSDDDRLTRLRNDDGLMLNRQINDLYYIPNGAIYILSYELLKNKRTYYSDNTIGYTMPREVSIDIDCIFDFKLAEIIIRNQRISCHEEV